MALLIGTQGLLPRQSRTPETGATPAQRAMRICLGWGCALAQIAAVSMISTLYFGSASLDSTVARAGALPFETHSAQALFISAKVDMSESQMFAFRILVLSLPAWASVSSICCRMFLVCS